MTERSVEDRMGEALRAQQLPQQWLEKWPWGEVEDDTRKEWLCEAEELLDRIAHAGLKVAVEEGDNGDD